MIVAFWVVAGLTAFAFVAVGVMKLVRPVAALRELGMGWIDDFPAPAVKLIAVAEVVGALGVVLPALTGVATILSPIAAVCLAVLMIGAVVVHLRRRESPASAAVLAAVALSTATLGFLVVG